MCRRGPTRIFSLQTLSIYYIKKKKIKMTSSAAEIIFLLMFLILISGQISEIFENILTVFLHNNIFMFMHLCFSIIILTFQL